MISSPSRSVALIVSHIRVLIVAQERYESTNQRDVITKLRMVKLPLPYPTHNLKSVHIAMKCHQDNPKAHKSCKNECMSHRLLTARIYSLIIHGNLRVRWGTVLRRGSSCASAGLVSISCPWSSRSAFVRSDVPSSCSDSFLPCVTPCLRRSCF